MAVEAQRPILTQVGRCGHLENCPLLEMNRCQHMLGTRLPQRPQPLGYRKARISCRALLGSWLTRWLLRALGFVEQHHYAVRRQGIKLEAKMAVLGGPGGADLAPEGFAAGGFSPSRTAKARSLGLRNVVMADSSS